MLQQATNRFADIIHSMKQMSLDMQRALRYHARGCAAVSENRKRPPKAPHRCAASLSTRWKLAELNRIVARHGRAMDTVGTVPTALHQRSYRDEKPGSYSDEKSSSYRDENPAAIAMKTLW